MSNSAVSSFLEPFGGSHPGKNHDGSPLCISIDDMHFTLCTFPAKVFDELADVPPCYVSPIDENQRFYVVVPCATSRKALNFAKAVKESKKDVSMNHGGPFWPKVCDAFRKLSQDYVDFAKSASLHVMTKRPRQRTTNDVEDLPDSWNQDSSKKKRPKSPGSRQLRWLTSRNLTPSPKGDYSPRQYGKRLLVPLPKTLNGKFPRSMGFCCSPISGKRFYVMITYPSVASLSADKDALELLLNQNAKWNDYVSALKEIIARLVQVDDGHSEGDHSLGKRSLEKTQHPESDSEESSLKENSIDAQKKRKTKGGKDPKFQKFVCSKCCAKRVANPEASILDGTCASALWETRCGIPEIMDCVTSVLPASKALFVCKKVMGNVPLLVCCLLSIIPESQPVEDMMDPMAVLNKLHLGKNMGRLLWNNAIQRPDVHLKANDFLKKRLFTGTRSLWHILCSDDKVIECIPHNMHVLFLEHV